MTYSYKTDTTTLVVAKGKGGVGSTMTAMMLAFEYAARGAEVLLVDADQTSQTAARWYSDVLSGDPSVEMPFTLYTYRDKHGPIVKAIIDTAREYTPDIVILDMEANAAQVAQVAKFGDVFVGPTSVTVDDLSPCGATHRIVVENCPDANWVALLTRVPIERAGAAKMARQQLDGTINPQVKMPVARTEIRRNAPWYSDQSGTIPASRHQYSDLADELNPFLKRTWTRGNW